MYDPDKLAAVHAAVVAGEDLSADDVIALGLAAAHDNPAPSNLQTFVRAASRYLADTGAEFRVVPEAPAPADGVLSPEPELIASEPGDPKPPQDPDLTPLE